MPLKAALAMLNLATAEVRLPLIRATEPTKDRLSDVLTQIMSREEWLASQVAPMRSRADIRRLARDLLWACLVLAVAAYGAVVVRNITDTLVAITYHEPTMVVARRPTR